MGRWRFKSDIPILTILPDFPVDKLLGISDFFPGTFVKMPKWQLT